MKPVFSLSFLSLVCSLQLQAQNPSHLEQDIEYVLSNKGIHEAFGVEIETHKPCGKLVLMQYSELIPDTDLKRLNASLECLDVLPHTELFFFNVEAYFEIESFKESKRRGKLVLKLNQPFVNSLGQNQLYLELKYRIMKRKIMESKSQGIQIYSFEKKIVVFKTKEKKVGVLKYNLLE